MSRPTLLTVPGFAIALALGEFGRSSVLGGQRALPTVLEDAGFTFSDTTLDDALRTPSPATESDPASGPARR